VWGGSSAQFHMADRPVDDPEVFSAEDAVMSRLPTNLLRPGPRLSGT